MILSSWYDVTSRDFINRYNLGKVLEAMGEYEAASDCMATALQVQTSSPIVPFSAVPLCFEWIETTRKSALRLPPALLIF